MRVAYLTNHYPKVSHTFILREIHEMERQGFEVERFSIRGWDDDAVDSASQLEQTKTRYTLRRGISFIGIAILKVAIKRPKAFWKALRMTFLLAQNATRSWIYQFAYLGHACQLKLWLDKNPVSHLHAHFGTNPAAIALLLRTLGGPTYSFTAHGMDETENADKLGFQHKIFDASAVVTVSAYTRSQIMRYIDPDLWPKIKIIHCGLEARSFEGEKALAAVTSPIFLCIARLSPEKGHLVLLPAFRAVLEKHPEAKLILVGDGEMRSDIEKCIHRLGISHAVRISGWITPEQVVVEIRNSYTLVQPSFIEGMPVVVMEAMAQARPVISTYVAGIPELIKDGLSGYLVPAGDHEALAIAMQNILEAPPEALAKMGALGRRHVREHHSIETEVAKLQELFLEAAK